MKLEQDIEKFKYNVCLVNVHKEENKKRKIVEICPIKSFPIPFRARGPILYRNNRKVKSKRSLNEEKQITIPFSDFRANLRKNRRD